MTLDEAKLNLDRAVRDYVAADPAVREDAQEPFVTAWAVVYEADAIELTRDGQTIDDVIVPPAQMRSTTRGLLGLGMDHFTRGVPGIS